MGIIICLMASRIKALFPHTPTALDYKTTKPLKVGQMVKAPIRGKPYYGVVWGGKPNLNITRLETAEPEGMPVLHSGFIDFLKWVAKWNCISPHLVLKAAIGGFDPKAKPTRGVEDIPQNIKTDSTLTALQQKAFEALEPNRVNLLDGLTGSGKSWVYFEAVAQALANNKQAIILIPEIALWEQWQSNFKTRFGFAADVWHSGITPKARKRLWHRAITGEARVIAGARSALFVPVKNLALMVVDEEHDASYKQESGICYQARDMAVVRAKCQQAQLILASATPSLESLRNVELAKYNHIVLKRRFAKKAHDTPPLPFAENVKADFLALIVAGIWFVILRGKGCYAIIADTSKPSLKSVPSVAAKI